MVLLIKCFAERILFFLITSINQGPRMPLIFPPRFQNDIVSVIGHDIIVANAHLVAEVKQSKLYSVLADKVAVITLSNYLFAFDLGTVKAIFVKNS